MTAAADARAAAVFVDSVGEGLRGARYARRKSLVDVANETGLSRSTIIRIENGGDAQMFCLLAVLRWIADE